MTMRILAAAVLVVACQPLLDACTTFCVRAGEWIQYQLDTAESVADVIASDARVRIQGQIPLHYLVSDATGAAATIEFLDGRLVARSATRAGRSSTTRPRASFAGAPTSTMRCASFGCRPSIARAAPRRSRSTCTHRSPATFVRI